MGMFMHNPISGMGFDAIASQGLKYGFKDTHNIFVKTLAEQGLIGMFIFMALFVTAFRRALLLFQLAEEPFAQGLGLGFAACVIASLTTNFFGDRWSFMQVSSNFWVVMALVERSIIIEQESADGVSARDFPLAVERS
jgi:O-antigen ligase